MLAKTGSEMIRHTNKNIETLLNMVALIGGDDMRGGNEDAK
jgi:hypothetical protein